jgi:hypothetical protein
MPYRVLALLVKDMLAHTVLSRVFIVAVAVVEQVLLQLM